MQSDTVSVPKTTINYINSSHTKTSASVTFSSSSGDSSTASLSSTPSTAQITVKVTSQSSLSAGQTSVTSLNLGTQSSTKDPSFSHGKTSYPSTSNGSHNSANPSMRTLPTYISSTVGQTVTASLFSTLASTRASTSQGMGNLIIPRQIKIYRKQYFQGQGYLFNSFTYFHSVCEMIQYQKHIYLFFVLEPWSRIWVRHFIPWAMHFTVIWLKYFVLQLFCKNLKPHLFFFSRLFVVLPTSSSDQTEIGLSF